MDFSPCNPWYFYTINNHVSHKFVALYWAKIEYFKLGGFNCLTINVYKVVCDKN